MKKSPVIRKTVAALMLANITQLIALVMITGYVVILSGSLRQSAFFEQYLLMVAVVGVSVLNTVIAYRFRAIIQHADNQAQVLEDALHDTEKLNIMLRAQRHDFLNHLQVVYGLIEMDEYKDAKGYIETVYTDIQQVSRVLKTGNPAINALLQAKMGMAEKQGIQVEVEVTSKFMDLPAPPWEICRVLGNLLDNAIHALSDKPSDRKLQITLFENLQSYGFRIRDNGAGIPEEIQDKVFDPGFTTKGSKGTGMGLAISKEIMSTFGGSLRMSSRPGATVFEGILPRRPGSGASSAPTPRKTDSSGT